MKDVLVSELARQGLRWRKELVVQGFLHSFPPGYTLMSVPRLNDNDLEDAYLCTPDGKRRWRSPEEFGPHLAWLLTGQ